MTAAARGPGPASYRGASPWRPRPSPHPGWGASPHRGWGGHPAGRGQPAGRRAHRGSQHGRDCDLLTVNLTPVHVFQGLLRLLGRLKLHVGVAFGQVRVDAVHGHFNHLDLAIGGENLLDVLLDDVSCQPAQVDLSGLGCGAPTSSVSVILLC